MPPWRPWPSADGNRHRLRQPGGAALRGGSGRRGLLLDGRLVRDRHGGVGELAPLDHVDGVETATGWAFASRRGRGSGSRRACRTPTRGQRLDLESPSAADVLASAQIGDPVSEPLLRQISSVIARTCTVLRNFYDPEVLVVCGSHARALEPVLRLVRETLAVDSELPAPRLMASELGDEVVCPGRRHRSPTGGQTRRAAALRGAREIPSRLRTPHVPGTFSDMSPAGTSP